MAMAGSAPQEYVKTRDGDIVFKKAHVHGLHNLFLMGRSIIMPGVIIRGELQEIRIGRYSVVGEGTVIRPAYRIEQEESNLKCRFTPLSVGSHTYIGKSCVIESAGIGCNVRIEDGCVLGRNSFVRDNCHLLPGTVLPEGAVVPPFTVLQGCPARMVSALHESTPSVWTEDAVNFYETFEPSAVETSK
ncbi:unnamed protein product [Ectocarpus sp. 13 AM-2016]